MTAYLNALGLICTLGHGQADVAARLFAGDCSGMRPAPGWIPERQPPVGAVTQPLPAVPLPEQHSRNNQLLYAAALQIEPALRQAITQYGAHRVGVVLGTSTSGIAEGSAAIGHFLASDHFPADYHYAQQVLSAPADFLADWLQLGGPAYVISTACTSSGRALLSARRLLDLGVCDAVLCGGVDSLCHLTLNGFSALEAISDRRCNPFSANRDGINIGEAAALFLMTRAPEAHGERIALLGAGASSDAHHISAPDPTGAGALQCMGKALDNAGLEPAHIHYLNLHGTATPHNDAMESLAVDTLFGAGLPCSSSKPMTGHTLGAAGALEAAFCWLSLSRHNPLGLLPPHLWDGQPDPALPELTLVDGSQRLAAHGPRRLMSNSFAFGGNNVSLILGDIA
ncbi:MULTISPECIES: beta-ketoacyl-[acyl-carrier-protein] synthase family protein [Pseudomonas]|uniref:beta-ketoacyl-[acyl-carrier-protein] synthase family protein n=1 Tax=Pseudomonas TaxID=286 RepID=UPI0018AC7317|nr:MULTISPECIES: beta-ketoacyl-[acyl-carrier-protein] synthase family protein [Pseudomonas]MBF8764769.1 beta-ketoacyl-[acyl-carrier-protein] synthase family protein [Pseudomonas putida]MBH3343688.1 beta-ketoacyl-[acyl-carrier-protein] synthase family protein [Pseudomonas parafulva]MEC4021330.1 beta-ketoacyl-[acyl-carrier-protein] synthase family protein [Pseudomonas fulva]